MKVVTHVSAKPSHYNKESEGYDEFNEHNSQIINRTIETLLRKYNVKTVLDITCGTGSQVFYLHKHGYQVVGADFNAKMLAIAKQKAKKENLKITFLKCDMRTARIGEFDAVITIFNAIGHLTKNDFEQALNSISVNLNKNSIYIFDIFNRRYLEHADTITKLTIDWQTTVGKITTRKIQYSTIDDAGILTSNTITLQQSGKKTKINQDVQTLQTYSAQELKQLLTEHGFKVVHQSAIDGATFDDKRSERILVVAQKK
ncbi:MAG: Glycine/sarcosine N-methyltransferase [Candidatus Dependentiae bacterium ADurb.Bin331]|nr:MAG: Glycine/sarcosine N-methyltransferase [Candidatus Dependentiae bacterium ADurb.Bin331]